jgi:hypothetical protein
MRHALPTRAIETGRGCSSRADRGLEPQKAWRSLLSADRKTR